MQAHEEVQPADLARIRDKTVFSAEAASSLTVKHLKAIKYRLLSNTEENPTPSDYKALHQYLERGDCDLQTATAILQTLPAIYGLADESTYFALLCDLMKHMFCAGVWFQVLQEAFKECHYLDRFVHNGSVSQRILDNLLWDKQFTVQEQSHSYLQTNFREIGWLEGISYPYDLTDDLYDFSICSISIDRKYETGRRGLLSRHALTPSICFRSRSLPYSLPTETVHDLGMKYPNTYIDDFFVQISQAREMYAREIFSSWPIKKSLLRLVFERRDLLADGHKSSADLSDYMFNLSE